MKYQPTRFRRINITEVKSISNHSLLSVVKIDSPLVDQEWTTAIQKINIPWSESLCEKYLHQDCHLTMATEPEQPTTVQSAVQSDGERGQKRVKKLKNLPIVL